MIQLSISYLPRRIFDSWTEWAWCSGLNTETRCFNVYVQILGINVEFYRSLQ
jgi:hypothetical protein